MNKLKHFRELKGLSQEQVSRMVDFSLNHYYRIEKGKTLPNIEAGLKLALILNCDPFILWCIREF